MKSIRRKSVGEVFQSELKGGRNIAEIDNPSRWKHRRLKASEPEDSDNESRNTDAVHVAQGRDALQPGHRPNTAPDVGDHPFHRVFPVGAKRREATHSARERRASTGSVAQGAVLQQSERYKPQARKAAETRSCSSMKDLLHQVRALNTRTTGDSIAERVGARHQSDGKVTTKGAVLGQNDVKLFCR